MEDDRRVFIDELPFHLLIDILISKRLPATDLVCLEQTCQVFRGNHGLFEEKEHFRSLIEFVAFQLCLRHSICRNLDVNANARTELFNRCGGNWKRVSKFLQSVEQSSDLVQTASGKNMQITTGRYHTLLISDSSVYSCGSSLCGVLGHGPETTQSVSFTRIEFLSSLRAVHVSASYNHAAFVMQSGEIILYLRR